MNVIQTHNLTVAKEKTEILHDLNVAVKKGVITGLVGPSGSGKTTLMRCIVGVQKYKGNLTVLKKPAGSVALRPRIGYVTQSPAVYDDLTIMQNLRYFAQVIGTSMSEVAKIINLVELTKHAHKLVGNLSGGQRARVSLAVALLGDPELLVLDEPTVGLDPLLRNELWQQFSELTKLGKTIIVSSHVMDEADRCDEVLLLRDGGVLWNDTRQKLLTKTRAKNVNDAFIVMVTSKK